MTTQRSGPGEPGTLADFLARPHRRVILDVGCGDARATARLAAAEPDALVVGVDANLDAAARVMRRARRSPEKGGLSNLRLVQAAVDRLPSELAGRVDELHVDLPWGSLLQGLLAGDAALLSAIGRVLAPGGHVRVVLNAGSLPVGRTPDDAAAALGRTLALAGLGDVRTNATAVSPTTGWGKRLSGGRPLPVVVAEADRPTTTASIASSP